MESTDSNGTTEFVDLEPSANDESQTTLDQGGLSFASDQHENKPSLTSVSQQQENKQTVITNEENEDKKESIADGAAGGCCYYDLRPIGLRSPLAEWMKDCNIDEEVIKLIYWYSYYRSGVTFGGLIFILLTLQCYTFISTVTCFSIAILTVAFIYRIGLTVSNAIQKTGSEHPFRELLEKEFEINDDTMVWFSTICRTLLVHWGNKLKALFLIEDILESLKFGIILWFLSYIGAVFSLVTMVTIGCVLVFTIPKFYEEYQEQTDALFETIKQRTDTIVSRFHSSLPANLGGAKEKPE